MTKIGCTFRAGLMPWLWDKGDDVDIFEHSLDAFVGAGRDGLRGAATCSNMKDFSLHAIGMSLGSKGIQQRDLFLEEMAAVIRVMGATEISDHLAFSNLDGVRLHDFAPLWRVEEQLDIFVDNVNFVQDRLGVRLSVENVATLFDLGGELRPSEFANEVSRRTGCGLLLDISNVLINEANGFTSAEEEFAELDMSAVTQVHLAGGELVEGRTWDAHSHPVPSADLEWLERLLPRMTNLGSVIIERDERLKEGHELVADLRAVRQVVELANAAAAPALL